MTNKNIDREKLVAHLESELRMLKKQEAEPQIGVRALSDIIRLVNNGRFGVEDTPAPINTPDFSPGSIEFETYRKCVRGDIDDI